LRDPAPIGDPPIELVQSTAMPPAVPGTPVFAVTAIVIHGDSAHPAFGSTLASPRAPGLSRATVRIPTTLSPTTFLRQFQHVPISLAPEIQVAVRQCDMAEPMTSELLLRAPSRKSVAVRPQPQLLEEQPWILAQTPRQIQPSQ
jgi:hypothetical protein